MVGVVEGGEKDDEGEPEVDGAGREEECRKEIDSVPEKRTIETESAMGRIAVSGRG